MDVAISMHTWRPKVYGSCGRTHHCAHRAHATPGQLTALFKGSQLDLMMGRITTYLVGVLI